MITIIGVGALGSHVALLLRNEKVPITVVDFDKVEQKNTQSQFHSKMSLGKNKAKALQQSMAGLFGVHLYSVPHKLTRDNIDTVLSTDTELVIDCTDNIVARRLIQGFAGDVGTPCLHGALSADGMFSRVMWSEEFAPDEESGDGATCEDGEFLPFIAVTSAWLAIVAQDFLKTGKKRSWQLTPTGVTRLA